MVKYENVIPYIPREYAVANFWLITYRDCLVAHIENAKLSTPKCVLCTDKTITTTTTSTPTPTATTSTTTPTATTTSAAADLYKLILTF